MRLRTLIAAASLGCASLAAPASAQAPDPAALGAQVDRLLKDARSEAFVRNFTGQWLSLRDIDFTEPSHQLYPEFDDMLKVSMVRETELFFDELLNFYSFSFLIIRTCSNSCSFISRMSFFWYFSIISYSLSLGPWEIVELLKTQYGIPFFL